MTILDNAITAIQVGVEDFQSKDPRRKFSAIRNIYAGLLLLYKEKLRQLSPTDNQELLLKSKLKPTYIKNGGITLTGVGKHTVDARQIEERFKDFNVSVTWKHFRRIKDLRNDLEHYYTSETPEVITEILAKSCLLIQEFVSKELNLEPSKLFGDDCWRSLLDIEDVYEMAKNDCMETLYKIVWPYEKIRRFLSDLECPACNSELIKHIGPSSDYPQIDMSCHSCGEKFQYSDILVSHLEKIYFSDLYLSMTQGGEPPINECPSCDLDTFIIDENVCVHCGFKYIYQKCTNCNCEIGANSFDSDAHMCDQCDYWDFMKSKDSNIDGDT